MNKTAVAKKMVRIAVRLTMQEIYGAIHFEPASVIMDEVTDFIWDSLPEDRARDVLRKLHPVIDELAKAEDSIRRLQKQLDAEEKAAADARNRIEAMFNAAV